jgi:hypothetical protein
MDRLTALQLPHFLIIAGALFVIVGFIGYAFRKNREGGAEAQQAPGLCFPQVNNGNGQDEGDEVASKHEGLPAELSSLSASELRRYLASLEDGVLHSGNPLAANIVHAARRARDRKESETDVPFGKLLNEEMDRLNARGK